MMRDSEGVSSSIVSVQVYRRGATVVRRAVVDAAALIDGGSIEFVGLPLCMTDSTARINVVSVEPSSSRVTAVGLAVGVHVRPGTPPEKAPERKEFEELSWRINEIEELVRVLDNEIDLLASIPMPDRPQGEDGRAPPPAPLAMRLALEGFVDDAAESRRAERRTLQQELRKLQKDQEALAERITAASTAAAVKASELSKSLIVPLRVEGAPKSATIEVRYHVPGARWAPAYHVKLARDGTSAVIHQRAFLQQATGEDWSGVRLKLSTAFPLRYGELPELASVRIGKAQPPPKKTGFRPPPKGSQALFADFDRDAGIARSLIPAPRPWTMPSLDAGPSLAVVTDETNEYRTRKKEKRAKGGGPGSTSGIATRMAAAAARDDDALYDDDYDAESVENESIEEDASSKTLMLDRSELAKAAYAPPPPSPASPAPAARVRAAVSAPRGARMDESRAGGRGKDAVVDAITFPLLRLPGPDDGARGRLVPVDLASLYQQSAARAGRLVPFSVKQLIDDAANAAQLPRSQVPPLCVDVSSITSSFDFAYESDGVVDVAADGHWHSVPLGDRTCEASVRYIAVPREELAVYRVAVIQNALGAPLLSGPAEVYVGGEFVLTTQLPTVVSKGELTLGLGVEQAIKVARNARFKEVREGEGVVAMLELVHDIDVDVVNHLGRSIDIEVRERVPIPEHNAEVQVNEKNVEPAWEAYDQEERGSPLRGGRRWRVNVSAGETQALRATYALKLFSNSEIQGGNRRET